MKDELVELSELLSVACKPPDNVVSYNGKILRFKYPDGDQEKLKKAFSHFDIAQQFYPGNECEIELDKKYRDDVVIFLNEADFLKRIDHFKQTFEEDIYLIISYDDHFLIKETKESFSQKKAVFFNIIAYNEIIDFVTSNTDFISLHDKIQYEFIIFSGDKGPFYIGYNRLEERVKNLPDLRVVLNELKESFAKIDFIQFFKEAVIQGIHKEPVKNRLFILIQSLRVLLEIATRDHRIYLKKFGFDKIKAKFKEERIKYFESIEKNIDSVSKQVTSFPLTFAATVFAGYQVKDKPAILILVFLGYALYTLVAWKILSVVSFNTESIKTDVDAESKKIENEYNLLFTEFKPDFDKIADKIGKLNSLITILRSVLIGLLAAFLVFSIYEIFFVKQSPPSPTEVRIVK